MNGPQTPAFTRNNSFTRLIDRVAEMNEVAGKPAGRSVEQMGRFSPVVPAARASAVPDYVPTPLDPRHAMHANARAAALGMTNDGKIGAPVSSEAGEPSDDEIDRMLANAGTPPPGVSVPSEEMSVSPLQTSPPTPVHVKRSSSPPGLSLRAMPDFTKVEGFDLIKEVALIDGVEFRLAKQDVLAMKKFAIEVVLENVTYQVAQALIDLGIPEDVARTAAEGMQREIIAAKTPGGMSGAGKEVREVPGAEAAVPVSPKNSGEGRETSVLSTLQQRDGAEEGVRTSVPSVGERSSDPISVQKLFPGTTTDDISYLLGDGSSTPS